MKNFFTNLFQAMLNEWVARSKYTYMLRYKHY